MLKDCIVQLCLSKPENPITFLKEYFTALERVSFVVFVQKKAEYTSAVICVCSMYGDEEDDDALQQQHFSSFAPSLSQVSSFEREVLT